MTQDAPSTEGIPVGSLVRQVSLVLARGGVVDPRTEARDLVAAMCGQPRFWPAAKPHTTLDRDIVGRAKRAALVRAQGAPFAYAVGRAAFRFLTLEVDERVLIPRQETEGLVELVLSVHAEQSGGIAVDVGTGSGAIALALASESTFSRVIGTDVASDALDVALANERRLRPSLRARVEFRHGAGLAPVTGLVVDVIVSNPPYIAFDEAGDLPPSVRDWEPAHALLSGGGGLTDTRAIVRAAPSVLRHGGLLALEVDVRRASLVAELCASNGSFTEVRVHRDLTGRDRYVVATRA